MKGVENSACLVLMYDEDQNVQACCEQEILGTLKNGNHATESSMIILGLKAEKYIVSTTLNKKGGPFELINIYL